MHKARWGSLDRQETPGGRQPIDFFIEFEHTRKEGFKTHVLDPKDGVYLLSCALINVLIDLVH